MGFWPLAGIFSGSLSKLTIFWVYQSSRIFFLWVLGVICGGGGGVLKKSRLQPETSVDLIVVFI